MTELREKFFSLRIKEKKRRKRMLFQFFFEKSAEHLKYFIYHIKYFSYIGKVHKSV
jgi:hypothetical protein